MYPQAFFSCLILLIAWGYFFWSSWSVYFSPPAPWTVLLFNFVVVIISAYVTFERSLEFRKVAFTSSQAGILCCFIFVLAWIAAGVAGLPELQQSISIMMVPAIILATLGPYVARILWFPLFYFLLIIPFYESNFAGRFMIAWLAFALIFSYFRYTAFFHRFVYVFCAAMIPLIILWLQLDPLIPSIFGFFVLLLLGYFFTEPRKFYSSFEQNIQLGRELIMRKARWLIPTAVLFVTLASAPWLSSNIRAFYPRQQKPIVLISPQALGDWVGPKPAFVDWDPKFISPSATTTVEYYNKSLQTIVYLYSAYYQSNRSVRHLLDPENILYDPKVWTKVKTQNHTVLINPNTSLVVMETLLEREGTTQLIWSWFYVLGIPSVDVGFLELLDKVRLISKYADGSGIIAISTDVILNVDQARNRLESFLKEMYPALEILERPERVSSSVSS